MKILILFLFIFPALIGCSPVTNIFDQNIYGNWSENGNNFSIGRVAFQINLNPKWSSTIDKKNQIASFNYKYPEQDAFASTIAIFSYHSRITWLEDTWDDIDEIARRLQIDYDNQTFKKTRKNQNYNLKIVQKSGLNCIREEESWGAPQQQGEFVTPFSGSFNNNLDYICLVPGQLDRRPINIGVAQSVGSRATPLDLETLLEPIFESLVLNPDPPPVPKRYEWVPVSKEEALKYWQ